MDYRDQGLSRRSLLAAAASGVTGLVAGCSSQSNPTGVPATPDPPAQSVFEDVSFGGTDMVVRLTDGHAVSRVNLIDPNGSLYAQARVAAGVTTVRLPILDIKPLGGGYDHYTPGTHTLVAVREPDPESLQIQLVPELKIRDIWQYREGGEPNDYAQLAVDIENAGTSPTWVYDVKTKDAPNSAANVPLGDDPGILHLEYPKNPDKAIILPGNVGTFVGVTLPLLFVDQNDPSCGEMTEMSVLVGSAIGSLLEQRVHLTVKGEVKSIGLIGEYACTEAIFEFSR